MIRDDGIINLSTQHYYIKAHLHVNLPNTIGIIRLCDGNRKGRSAVRSNPGKKSLRTLHPRAHPLQAMQNDELSENVLACL